jgi:hypothetical protein
MRLIPTKRGITLDNPGDKQNGCGCVPVWTELTPLEVPDDSNESRWFTSFEPLHHGDCALVAIRLILNSNGHGQWTGIGSTTKFGDIWHCSVNVYDHSPADPDHDKALWSFGNYDGPKMYHGNGLEYYMGARFTFDPSIIPRIKAAWAMGWC